MSRTRRSVKPAAGSPCEGTLWVCEPKINPEAKRATGSAPLSVAQPSWTTACPGLALKCTCSEACWGFGPLQLSKRRPPRRQGKESRKEEGAVLVRAVAGISSPARRLITQRSLKISATTELQITAQRHTNPEERGAFRTEFVLVRVFSFRFQR